MAKKDPPPTSPRYFLTDTEVGWEMDRAVTRGKIPPRDPLPKPPPPDPNDPGVRAWRDLMSSLRAWALSGTEFTPAPMDDIESSRRALLELGDVGRRECVRQLQLDEDPAEARLMLALFDER
jgi:hypothetical protein